MLRTQHNYVYYDNGVIKQILSYKNKKLHGYCAQFDIHGNYIYEEVYKDGLLCGACTYYYDNRKIIIKRNYKDNIKHGIQVGTFYDPNKVELYIEGKKIDSLEEYNKLINKC